MPDQRYPTLDEFWEGLDAREVEADLRDALRERAATEGGPITRVGCEATAVAVAARILPGAVPASAMTRWFQHGATTWCSAAWETTRSTAVTATT